MKMAASQSLGPEEWRTCGSTPQWALREKQLIPLSLWSVVARHAHLACN